MSEGINDFFRPGDAMERVKISRSTLYRWKDAKIITKHKVGGMTYFSESEILKVIREGGVKEGVKK